MPDQDENITDDAADAAADVSTDDSGADVAADADDKVDGEEALGDAGKQALDRTKQRLKDERAARRALEAELAELRKGKPAEGEQPDVEAIRAEARREAQAEANQRALRAEIKAAATGKLADPADALTFIDATDLEVDADGNVDADELAEAIDDLLKRKPYLAAAAQGGQRFKGTADGGTRKETRPAQLTQADMARMSPEQIVDATDKGQFDVLLGRT
jgi:hypothetical protein